MRNENIEIEGKEHYTSTFSSYPFDAKTLCFRIQNFSELKKKITLTHIYLSPLLMHSPGGLETTPLTQTHSDFAAKHTNIHSEGDK